MLNIDSLITTYSGMLETLKEIRRKEQELLSFDSVKQELKKVQKENQELKDQIKWNKKHINILSRTLGEKICTDCGGEGGFEGYEGDGGPCENCSTTGLIKI